ncbi:11148_t:CDS:2 [Funneliformis geosporum]|uniref:18418_t:CDS:1 n=1 Tax=Funneliformis geosporum TaxID=1117311 RepID=A0A9W4X0G0_9GLOM|nr:11148_t:CDS:2 [Funneliformis geosporum]CAI2177238.1 18418_t:CDS:2 [Funneliformis geosporum]
MDTFLLTLSNDFNKILENELCYDLIITIGKEPVIDTFRVHSAILCARCPYFQVALSNNWIKKDDDKFTFSKPNIYPKTFEVILRYLYGGTINLDRQGSSDLILLLEASDELCLNELCEYIQDCIITKRIFWLRENFSSLAKTVYQHPTFAKLQKVFTEMIYEDPKRLFKLESLPELPEDTLLFLLSCDDFFLKEVQIWQQIIKWGTLQNPHLDQDVSKWSKEDFEILKVRLRKSIPLIRFYQMSLKEFNDNVVPFRSILPDDLYKNVLKYHSRWFKFYPRVPARVKPIDSTIVNYKDAAILASWIDGKDKINNKDTYEYHDNPYNFKLLYRGSRDGFTYGALKKHCYYKGPTIVVAKIKGKQELIGGYNPLYWTTSELPYSSSRTKNGFIFSAKRNKDNFQEEATVARIKYDYAHFTTYRGYPYLSFGFNNLSFHGRECHVRFSHSLCFFPRIKVPDNYLLDEFEVFAVIPKSSFKYWKNNLIFYSSYICDIRFYKRCFILLVKLLLLIFLSFVSLGFLINSWNPIRTENNDSNV